jgi:hypothetical protein
MPKNGVAIPLPIPPEISFAPAPSAEDQIGKVLVEFTAISVRAWQEVQGGKMSAVTRSQGGDLVAQLYWIRTELGETKFVAAMHQQARVRLGQHHLSEETATEIAEDLLDVVNKVVATMRAMN